MRFSMDRGITVAQTGAVLAWEGAHVRPTHTIDEMSPERNIRPMGHHGQWTELKGVHRRECEGDSDGP